VLTVRATVIAGLTVLVLSLSLPASAGGPTSALLSVPGEGRTASLYYTDAAYHELTRLVGISDGPGPVDDSGQGHASGTEVTVTWLLHDVMPWRIDRIYLGADGGPWIATQELGQSGSLQKSPVLWHRSTSGKELATLLDSFGLGPGTPAPRALPEQPAAVEPVTEPQPEPSTAAPTTAEDGSNGAWWGLGGLAAGLLLALGWTRARSARAEKPEPDLDPAQDWLAPVSRR
jgi:hypothetical protein